MAYGMWRRCGVGRYLMSLVSAASSALAPCACVVRVCSVVLMAWLVRVKASDTSDAWRSHAAYMHKEEEGGKSDSSIGGNLIYYISRYII